MGIDHALADLAATQGGVVSLAQLGALGMKKNAVWHRCERGSLHKVGPNVFAVGHAGVSRRGRGFAALLHAGPNAALSHQTAARLWGLVETATDGPIHVSVRNRSRLEAPDNVVIHRPRTLSAADIANRNGLRVTSPERTIIDHLADSSVSDITRMLEQMVTHLGKSPDDLHVWGHALKGRVGKSTLVRALDNVAGPAVIRSEFESRFRSVCQDAGVPLPNTNYKIAGWELDAAWVAEKVAVELDGYRWHGGRWQFHRDRRKGLAICRAGYELIRLSWPQLKYERDAVVDGVRQALARGELRRAGLASKLG